LNWLDLALIVILIVFVAIGFWKGFMFSILSLFSTFINFMIALLLTKPTATLFNKWFHLEGALTKSLANKISGMHAGFNTNLVGMNNSEIKSHISTTLKEGDFPLPRIFNNMLKVNTDKIGDKTSLTLTDILSKSLGTFFSLVITFIILFILIYIILFLLSLLSKKARESDGVRTIDRILGVVFGIAKYVITIVFLFAILSFFKEGGALKPVFQYIGKSEIAKFIYSNVNLFVDKYITLSNVVSIIK